MQNAAKLDLEKRGWVVYTTTSGHSPVDMIGINRDTGLTLRFQVKYRQNGRIPSETSWADKNGSHRKEIDQNLIDYFILVHGDNYEHVCYAPASFVGKTIRFEKPASAALFYWWEDFLEIHDPVSKHQYAKKSFRDFGYKFI